jgi:hypothetical protein
LLQAKNEKKTAKDKDLTFPIVKALFLSDMSDSADSAKKIRCS